MDVALGFLAGLLVAGAAALVWRRIRAVDPAPVDDTADLAETLVDVSATLLTTVVDAPSLSVGDRLTLLDELRSRDLVGAEDHATARQQVLGPEES